MLLAAISTTLSTLFAAIAAVGALGAIAQAGRNHRADAADRAVERRERREQFEIEAKTRREEFERESEERRRAFDEERRTRLLDQLARIGDQVAVVRETARVEAAEDGSINSPIGGVGVAPRERARFFWNARSQLVARLAAYRALGGNQPLDACKELAVGSTMDHLMTVVGTATSAFEELARATEGLRPAREG